MTTLCKMFCPDELERELQELEEGVVANSGGHLGPVDSDDGDDDDEVEEEEEEEED